MKRVLVLNHFAVPLGAPGGTRHTELFSRLSGWSHLILNASTSIPTTLSNPSHSGFLTTWAYPFERNGPKRVLNWASFATGAIMKTVLGQRPDLVYASSPHLLTGLAGWTLARRWRVPLVLEIRDLWPQVLVDMGQFSKDSPTYQVLVKIEEFLYEQADQIVVMSRGSLNDLVSRGVPPSKITYIPNSADPSDFETDEPRESLRHRYGFLGVTCVYLGAHGPANGLDFLLDAADSLRNADVNIVLIGQGPEKERLESSARTRGLTKIRFFDAIPKSEVPSLLAAADVGLHVLADVPLFRYGISPNKVFDYLASGTPLITNVPGEIGSLVIESGGGIVVDPSEIADGIRTFLALSPEERALMGRRGKEFIAERQSRTAMADRLQDLLDKTVRKASCGCQHHPGSADRGC